MFHLFTEGGEGVKEEVKVRVEVTIGGREITVMEKIAYSVAEALGPRAIKEVENFLVNERLSLSTDYPYDLESDDLTIKERLVGFLRFDERAPQGWFTSSQVRKIYEEVFDENVRLSTISTYLASLHSDGTLERKGSRAKRSYLLRATDHAKAASAVV